MVQTLQAPDRLQFAVSGMDCPSCVGKLETALGRMPGISDVSVNFTGGTLSLTAAAPEEARASVPNWVGALGFAARPLEDDAPVVAADDTPWWKTGKGRLVLATGVLTGLAFVLSFLDPALAQWPYVAAALLGLVPFGRRAIALARAGSPFSIETLMTVAAIGAIGIGAAEEAAIVVFLFAVGELLEGVAAGRARAGIKALVALVPRDALVETHGQVVTRPASALKIGDIVQIRPGDRVPADGTIIEGRSTLDESAVTGESVPVGRGPGDAVRAGTINGEGRLRVEVTHDPQDNTIARIIRMVEDAQGSKAPTARFIERFSRWYTPAAMLVAALVIAVPPLAFGQDWTTWIYRGLSLLLIACPCALVLSTPAAIASAIAAGARRGLLLKGGAALEHLGRIRHVAFDKTGTLTEGRPRVTDVVTLVMGNDVLALAAAVEGGSSHPLARAITVEARARNLALPQATDAGAVAGRAAHAMIDGQRYEVASPRHAAEALDPAARDRVTALEGTGKTVVVLLREGQALGLIALRDEPRPDAAAAVARLRRLGIEPVMLTGDNRRTGEAVAGALGLAARAELLPQDKLAEIEQLRADGGVAMVGDGINDAPALAAATVGIAMGGGTDVALDTADAALLHQRLGGVAELVALSRRALANIHQNIAIALGLKALFLVTTLGGATTLWMAILADTGATVIVTLNALRLLRRDADA